MIRRFSLLNRNHYFVCGLLIGLILSLYVPQDLWDLVQEEECPLSSAAVAGELNDSDQVDEDFEPHLNLINKPLAAKKPVKNVIRPRYYSSELGIREKLFIGVITTQENINRLATGVNRTVAHLVNKIKFFISADNVKSTFKLKNIVGFTDTRENLKPFHILKYIADNYLDDYDYFLLVPDTIYVNARRLQSLLRHISITNDIYMGRKYDISVGDAAEIDGSRGSGRKPPPLAAASSSLDDNIESDRTYCDLDAGILLSSSVIRNLRANLDWCVRNAVSNFHSINIGKCVKYSSKISGCQENFQGMAMKSYKLATLKLYQDLHLLTKDDSFRNATIIYPVLHTDDQYILHAHFSRLHLESFQQINVELENKSYRISDGRLPNSILEIRWPLGTPRHSLPENRHDLLHWNYMNATHTFMPNHEINVQHLSQLDREDFHKILNNTLNYALAKFPKLKYIEIHSAYRKFDPVRGMDYRLFLKFFDGNQIQTVIKRFEIVKPLGRVEIVPSPYVTESTRIAILLPTFENQTAEAINFVKQYEKICMANQENTFLMVIFLYHFNTPNKGEFDPFRQLKALALQLSDKFKTDGSRIAWVSIRLPQVFSETIRKEDVLLNTIYAENEILSLAVTDLALRKIGLESLVLMASNSMTFKADFLNRVRMNTIQNFQIFAPIGFMMYPCKFANLCKECETCDVAQSTGYFDKFNYDVVAFYSRDYVEARKKIENLVPIVRTDIDIVNLPKRTDQSIKTLVDMFVRAKLPVHILRAVEPNLRFGQRIKNFVQAYGRNLPQNCPTSTFQKTQKCIRIASRKQIGDALVKFSDKISDKRN